MSDVLPFFFFLSRPLALIFLSVFFFQQTEGLRSLYAYMMQFGLFASLVGEVFWMFRTESLFLGLGLSFSFFGIVAYTISFFYAEARYREYPILIRKPWLVLIFLIYGLAPILLLYPNLREWEGPVITLMVSLVIMCLVALNRWRRVPQGSFGDVLMGALLLLLSLSLSMLSAFAAPTWIPFSEYWILITCSIGHYLIATGYLKQLVIRFRSVDF